MKLKKKSNIKELQYPFEEGEYFKWKGVNIGLLTPDDENILFTFLDNNQVKVTGYSHFHIIEEDNDPVHRLNNPNRKVVITGIKIDNGPLLHKGMNILGLINDTKSPHLIVSKIEVKKDRSEIILTYEGNKTK